MNISKFHMILIGIFMVASVAALLVFGLSRSKSSTLPRVTIWGTIEESSFNSYVARLKRDFRKEFNVRYSKISPAQFDKVLIESLASGRGPDVIILSHDLIMRYEDKIFPIPYATLSQRAFKDRFIEEGELYLTSRGTLALPFIIDPMVMYWNRNLFANASLATPPLLWEEVQAIAPRLVKRDGSGNIIQSAVALGEYSNVTHAKELLSLLMLQAGTHITERTSEGVVTRIAAGLNYSTPPAQAAVSFYTQFSNPVHPSYSWNRSLSLSRDAFAAEDLAIYFGFASELPEIRRKNPNLNFDVAYMPQAKDARKKITYGNMYGFAIMNISPVKAAAYTVISELTSPQAMAIWSATSGLPPVRRELLARPPSDDVGPIFYNSALWSAAWLDPARGETSILFKNLIESVSSGRSRVHEAVSRMDQELRILLPK
jgi:ABC-type glycerol-3-phosphate transport system substrate-binding protein